VVGRSLRGRTAGRHRPWIIDRCRSLSSAGEARWRLRRRRPIEKRGGRGARDRGRSPRRCPPRVAPGLHPALARNPSALSGATHHRPPPYIPTPLAAGLIPPLHIPIDPADDSEGASDPSKHIKVASISPLISSSHR
jgi:hypothetical protein